MKELRKKLTEQAQVNGEILRVDGILKHQIDTDLLMKCGREIYERFKNDGITKILTIEASGMAIACFTAIYFGVPIVYAGKAKGNADERDVYSARVVSYTHGKGYDIVVTKKYIDSNDRVLLIDDFLSHASDLKALISLTEQAGAAVVGAGVVIEKIYQGGGNDLRDLGYRIESIEKIASLDNQTIFFAD